MDWLSQLRWRALWARHCVRWLGYGLAATLLVLFTGLCWLSPLPTPVRWWVLGITAGLYLLTVIWAGWRSAPNELLRAVDREFSGQLGSCRRSDRGPAEDPSWNDVFAGALCGPLLTVLLYAAVHAIAGRLGYTPPSDRAFSLNLLLGAWLGLFTWIHLGARRSARLTERWLLLSGSVGLSIIAWTVVCQARQPDGEWSDEHAWGALFVLVIPLFWSMLHVIQGLLAHLALALPGRPADDDTGPGIDGPDGGAGRPVSPPPAPPRRSASYTEPRPGL